MVTSRPTHTAVPMPRQRQVTQSAAPHIIYGMSMPLLFFSYKSYTLDNVRAALSQHKSDSLASHGRVKSTDVKRNFKRHLLIYWRPAMAPISHVIKWKRFPSIHFCSLVEVRIPGLALADCESPWSKFSLQVEGPVVGPTRRWGLLPDPTCKQMP